MQHEPDDAHAGHDMTAAPVAHTAVHAGHDKHTGHDPDVFRRQLWIVLLLQ
ncbi:MAG: hypothetical protein ACXWMB_03215 [Candidatus Limnocylindria bacterium]